MRIKEINKALAAKSFWIECSNFAMSSYNIYVIYLTLLWEV